MNEFLLIYYIETITYTYEMTSKFKHGKDAIIVNDIKYYIELSLLHYNYNEKLLLFNDVDGCKQQSQTCSCSITHDYESKRSL